MSTNGNKPTKLQSSLNQLQNGAKPSPKLLLTNDDGPDSPFFVPWVHRLRDRLKYDVCVCIPDEQQSFTSKALIKGPFKINKREDDEYLVPGPPATCINIALYHFCSDADLVISGPNIGHNLGRCSVLSSGTVGGAMEGALQGKRAIALSFPFVKGWNNWSEYEVQEAVIKSVEIINQLWQQWDQNFREVDWFNVNVPLGISEDVETLITDVDQKVGYSQLYEYSEESGEYVWQPKGLKVFQHPNPQQNSDVLAVKNGQISISPMKLSGGKVQVAGDRILQLELQ